mgnify:CR=1
MIDQAMLQKMTDQIVAAVLTTTLVDAVSRTEGLTPDHALDTILKAYHLVLQSRNPLAPPPSEL